MGKEGKSVAYKGKNGETVYVGAEPVTDKNGQSWFPWSFKAAGPDAKFKIGVGMGDLAKEFTSQAKEQAASTSGVGGILNKLTANKITGSNQEYSALLNGPADWYDLSNMNNMKGALSEGTVLAMSPTTDKWAIENKDGSVLAQGKGAAELNSAFEALHPRGAGGKFVAKPGGPDSDAPNVPEDFVTNTEFVSSNEAKYKLKGGGTVFTTSDGDWSLYDAAGGLINADFGQENLDNTLAEYKKYNPMSFTKEEQSENNAPPTPPEGILNGKVKFLGQGEASYPLKDKHTLYTNVNGNWSLYDDKSGILVDAGSGQTSMNDALATAGFEVTPAVAKPSSAANELPTIPESHKDLQDGPGTTVQWSFDGENNEPTTFYSLTDGGALMIGEKTGQWTLTPQAYGYGAEPISGVGQEALNAAFEALHPRDASGHFISKGELGEPIPSPPGLSDFDVYKTPGGNYLYKKQGTSSWFAYNTPVGGAEPAKSVGGGKTEEDLAKFLKNEKPNKTVTPPPPKGQKAIGQPVNFSGMKQVGPKLGSNPGGQYETSDGEKLYIKQPKSNGHAKNELLAAALFSAAGGNTLNYHQVVDGDKLYVGTDWQPLEADNMSQLTSAQKKEAQNDFAIQAWLANWDAAGLTGDNVGVANGKVIPLDFGGSLLYRAQGSPKGAYFDNVGSEWESLRSSKNSSSQKLYGDMTAEQLKQSAAKLGQITPDQIKDLVNQYGPGSVGERQQLAQKLLMRQTAILKKAKEEGSKAGLPPKPPEPAFPPYIHESYSSWDSKYYERLDAAPVPTTPEAAAVTKYSGGAYDPWNKALRSSFGKESGGYPTKALQSYLAKASWPEEGTSVTRKVSGAFAEYLIDEAEGEHSFVDHGFASTD